LGLFGLAFEASVLLMDPGLLPSGGLKAATRRRVRTTTWISAGLVITTMVLVGFHERPALSRAVGVISALGSGGVALWAAIA
jgi:hypothetical protein